MNTTKPHIHIQMFLQHVHTQLLAVRLPSSLFMDHPLVICLSVNLSIHIYLYLLIYPSINVFIYLPIHLSTNVSINLCFYLLIY